MTAFARALAAIFALLAVMVSASAQDYPPYKPVRIIVPFAAGGPSDILARVLAQKLSASWKQSVIVDNRAGAGGSLGASIAAKSAPDGTTLLLSDTGILTIGPALYATCPTHPRTLSRSSISPRTGSCSWRRPTRPSTPWTTSSRATRPGPAA